MKKTYMNVCKKTGKILSTSNKVMPEWENPQIATEEIVIVDGWQYLKSQAPTRTIEQLREDKLTEVNLAYQTAVRVFYGRTPKEEIETWDKQRSEFLAYEKDNKAETPFIDLLAESAERTREEQLEKVGKNVREYEVFIARATGQRLALKAKIKQAKKPADLEKIVWVEV